MAQARPSQSGLVAGQGRQADEGAEADDPRVGQARAARVARDPGHQQAGGQREDRERHRRVGQRRVEEERQVDRRGQARAERQGPGPADRQAALLGDVGGEPPGEDRHDRPDHAPTRPGRPRRSTPAMAIGIAARNVGSGSQTSNAGRGNDERRRLVAPQGVRDEAATVEQVARDADVVGRVLRLREDDLRREDRTGHERHDEHETHRQERFAAGHRAATDAVAAQRVSAGSRQTG